jgi:hypothetical protein
VEKQTIKRVATIYIQKMRKLWRREGIAAEEKDV